MSRRPTRRRAGLSFSRLVESLLPPRKEGGAPDTLLRPRSAHRITALGGVIGAGFVVVVGRASALMLLPDPLLEAKAKVQFEEAVEVQGRRGDLLDRNGQILATTVELYALHVDPARLAEAPEKPADDQLPNPAQALADALAPIVGQPADALAARLSNPDRRDVRLANDLTPDVAAAAQAAVAKLARQDKRMRGALWTRATPSRFYPGREDASVLLGLVGHNGVGQAGLERALDRELRGATYKYVLWRDRKGRQVTPDRIHAEAGRTVVLTLDRAVQHVAEQAVERARAVTGAMYAYAVVVDVPTGEILAIANRPAQNPNDSNGLRIDSFTNHAAMDAIEPGSVFKPFVAAAALEEGLVQPETIIDCEGGAWLVGRKVIHDDHPKGDLDVTGVIKYSSNIGAAKLAFKLGPDKTLAYLRDFGFARWTGLNLPGETRGTMRGADDIKPIELATTSYGHGVTATAVQLAAAIATLGNGGVRMQPRILKELRDRHGTVLERYSPEIDRRVVSEDVARRMVEMMVTVTETGGTGTRARVDGHRVAGKTGTAWKHIDGGYSATDRIGSFVGLVPADNPRLAIAVVVDSPTIGIKYGGVVAGPAFSEIATESLRLLGVAPDPTLAEPSQVKPGKTPQPTEPPADVYAQVMRDVTWTTDGRMRLPPLTGLSLRDALQTIEGTGLAVRAQGSGRVAEQDPAPGTPLSPGATVTVTLR